MAIVPGSGEGIVVTLPDGAEIGFSPGPEGSLVPETRRHLRLHRLDDGSWELRDGPRATWSFDAGGSLTDARSGSSHLLLEREEGQVVALSETTSGRWVRLVWEEGRVATQTSSDGRVAAYRYRGSHLVEVTRPADHRWVGARDVRRKKLAQRAQSS